MALNAIQTFGVPHTTAIRYSQQLSDRNCNCLIFLESCHMLCQKRQQSFSLF
jgi:hypothetical protein